MEERYGGSIITVSTTVEEQAFRPALRCKNKWAFSPGAGVDIPTLELL